MKKLFALLLAVCMVASMAACSSGEKKDDANTLTLYSSETDELLDMIIPAFEKETGIKVERVVAKTGELMKRVESEGDKPQADVYLGGNSATLSPLTKYLYKYTSKNDAEMAEGFKNDGGYFTPYKADGSVIIVNKTKLKELGVEVHGYKDLLQPELKGHIAIGDAANSSSAREHLLNILVDFGNGQNESQEGWDYVKALLENAEGKVLNSSGAIYKGVSDGEYAVGLSYENPCVALKRDGADVDVIYMEEGTVFAAATVQILNNCKNLEGAKKFVDFVTSKEIQDRLSTEASARPLRADSKMADYMTPLDDIKLTNVDRKWAGEKKDYVAEKFTDLVTELG